MDKVASTPAHRNYALFDFDGTLSRGFISMDFLDYVHEKGLYDDGEYSHQMDILKQYKAKALPYDEWVKEWGDSWARGLTGKKSAEVEAAATTFFQGFQKNIYPQSRPLVQYLTAHGCGSVMVSAGVFEVVDVARRHLGMDATLATRCRVRDGKYTGELETSLHTHTGKGEAVKDLERQMGQPYFAFGDSSGDVGMLAEAAVPVCLNANAELSKIATDRGWAQMPIAEALPFVERKLQTPADSRLHGIPAEQYQAALLAARAFHSDAKTAVETVAKVADALYTGPVTDLSLDFGHSTVQASMHRPPQMSLADDVRLFESLRAVEKSSEAPYYNPLPMDAEHDATEALRILRLHLRDDPEQSAAYRELLPVFGDAHTTLGLVRVLYTLPPDSRQQVHDHFMKVFDHGRQGARKYLEETGVWGQKPPPYQSYGYNHERTMVRYMSNLVLFESVRQPQEPYDSYCDQVGDLWNKVFDLTSPTDHATAVELENRMRTVIEAVGRVRESGQPLDSSLEAFKGFHQALKTAPAQVSARVYLLATDERPALEHLAGHPLNVAEASQTLLNLVDWTRQFGPTDEALPTVIQGALRDSAGDVNFKEKLDHYLQIYRVTGDGTALQKLGQELDRLVEAGHLPRDKRDQMLAEMEAEMYRQAALGTSRDKVASAAYLSVLRRYDPHPRDTVEQKEDVVIIGGVSVPRRRHG